MQPCGSIQSAGPAQWAFLFETNIIYDISVEEGGFSPREDF